MPVTHERLWALAPEQAGRISALYRVELEAHEAQAADERPLPTEAEIAASLTRREGDVAVISVTGPIARSTVIGFYSGRVLAYGQDAIRAALREAAADTSVRAILLSVDSPGGVASGTKELADYIASIRKPVAAYVNGLAASAAYWLASATGRILCPTTGEVGSIGVIMCLPDMSAFYQKMGVSFQYVASGKYKEAGVDSRAMTEEERGYFQKQLDALHAIFKADVATRMGITAPEEQWGDAQVLLGAEALSLGLVSAIVRDEEHAIQTLLEDIMPKPTLETLSSEAPELLASIRTEAQAAGRKEAEAELAAKLASASANGTACAMAAMKAVCKPEDVQAVENLLAKAQALNLTPEQLAGVASLFPKAEAAPVAAPEAESRSAILAALQDAHAAPVNADAAKPQKSPLVADAERRAAAAQG